MKLYKTEAIVLRTRDFSEADTIITLYTLTKGKVQAIAKGSRKAKSRSRGAVQPFTYGDFMLYQGRSLDTVTQCEPKESFAHLREDLMKLAHSAYIAELVESFTVDGEPNEQVFLLLLTTLHLLIRDDPRVLTRAFELRFLNMLGYCPQLDSCIQCRRPVQKGLPVKFSANLGGLLCEGCAALDPLASPILQGSINTMKQLLKWDIRRLQVIRATEEVKREMEFLLRNYINERVERKLKSVGFLDSVMQ